jgi:hypothetical protein
MIYIYYNLLLWVRQLQKTLDMEAISSNRIDTIIAWRIETESSIMDSAPDWLQEEAVRESVVEE